MSEDSSNKVVVEFDQHSIEYRTRFSELARDVRDKCPVAWSERYNGYWVASGHREVFDLARKPDLLSNDRDVDHQRQGYQGIQIPPIGEYRSGFLEMDPPEQIEYRHLLNPHLSPAAVARWQPFVADLARACVDDVIGSGRLDFVEDLANVVPAVLTMGMLGLPLSDWTVYCEPVHASVWAKNGTPEYDRALQLQGEMAITMSTSIAARRQDPRPGLIDALINGTVGGRRLDDADIMMTMILLLGGGLDTTTALTGQTLMWLSAHPDERDRLRRDRGLIDTATEEFLRYFTPAQGDARTITQDCVIAGHEFQERDRILLSWAMANRDPAQFPDPDEIVLDRFPNRHASFGLGVHRCIGSNVARMTFKTMLAEVLDRLPDFRCDIESAEFYDTIGVINGLKRLPATFMPGARQGAGVQETMERWQARIDREYLADPITAEPR